MTPDRPNQTDPPRATPDSTPTTTPRGDISISLGSSTPSTVRVTQESSGSIPPTFTTGRADGNDGSPDRCVRLSISLSPSDLADLDELVGAMRGMNVGADGSLEHVESSRSMVVRVALRAFRERLTGHA